MNQNQIITRPVITEKSLKDVVKGIFTFEVFKKATKAEISKAVEKDFSVHVLRISTVLKKGKRKMVGRKRLIVKRPDMKIARVKLKKGEKIDLFEVGESK